MNNLKQVFCFMGDVESIVYDECGTNFGIVSFNLKIFYELRTVIENAISETKI